MEQGEMIRTERGGSTSTSRAQHGWVELIWPKNCDRRGQAIATAFKFCRAGVNIKVSECLAAFDFLKPPLWIDLNPPTLVDGYYYYYYTHIADEEPTEQRGAL